MKTLVKDGLSVFIFNDTTEPEIQNDITIVSASPYEAIVGCTTDNSVLYEGVTPPADWVGNKYLFDGTTWTVNPDWVDPATLEEQTND